MRRRSKSVDMKLMFLYMFFLAVYEMKPWNTCCVRQRELILHITVL